MYKINEMALSRSDAIDLCLNLGKEFAEHFVKVVTEGVNSENFNHHCSEMQAWFDKVRKIKLKPKGKTLNIEQYIDWFFTVGQNTEDVVGENNVDLYEKLIAKLLNLLNLYDKNNINSNNTNINITNIMKEILN